jgi:hypothetical protein
MLVEWVKQRFALCSRKIGAWHFRKVFKTYHGGRYCLRCWMNEMTYLPQSSLAWRIEHTGVDGRETDRTPEVQMEERMRGISNSALGLARAGEQIATVLDRYLDRDLDRYLDRYLPAVKPKGSRRGQGR